MSSCDLTKQYAERVLSGDIVAGKFVKAACQRHLDDLEDGESRGLHFDIEAASRAMRFFPAMMTVTAGAKEGEPFHLLEWMEFVVGNLFGWRRQDGLRRFRTAWIETGKGQAKALDVDTPIPTPGGFVPMGELNPGDEVYDEQGNICTVLQAHPILHGRDCSEIVFDDGCSIVASDDHLWLTEARHSGSSDHGAGTRGVKLSERGAWRNQVRTTAQIRDTLTYSNGKYQSRNHSVALAGAVAGALADLPLPPYIMGVWLGDGDSDAPRLTCSDEDLAHLMGQVKLHGGVCNPPKRTASANRFSFNLAGAKIRDGAQSRLKRLGVLRNKHIPRSYLHASRDQRAALLQGLMDTDGTVSKQGQCSYCGTNERLVDDVLALALSLGLKATKVKKKVAINGRKVGSSFHVNFYSDDPKLIFSLPRKQARVLPTHCRRRLSGQRMIVDVRRVETRPVRCITVSSSTSLFLCGHSYVPTHNSPLMGAIGLYLMGFTGVKRAECYAFANAKEQAKILFSDAVSLCRCDIPGSDTTLEGRGKVIIRGVGANAWRIEHPESGSKFEPIAATETLSGYKPIGVFGDEIHEMKTSRAIDLWQAAIDKMSGDPLMMLGTNTPAVDQQVGTELSEFYQKVATSEIPTKDADSAFSYIARVDEDDDPFEDESCWVKALPALGLTYPIENVRSRVDKAKHLPSERLATERLFFGVPVGSSGFWISEKAWSACLGAIDPDPYFSCFLGLDLSQKNDLTSLSAVWASPSDKLEAKTYYWTVDTEIERREAEDGTPYRSVASKGDIEILKSNVIDYTFVAQKVAEMVSEYKVDSLSVDPAMLSSFLDACNQVGLSIWRYEGPDKPAGSGLKIVTHAQGSRIRFEDKQLCMPHSITRLSDKILEGEIIIEENAITKICAANAVLLADGMGNQYFDKNRSRGRIDGMVSLAMAVGASKGVADGPVSYLQTRGVLFT